MEPAAKTLACERLNIVGPDGKTKASIHGTNEGSVFTLADSLGRPQLTAQTGGKGGPSIILWDKTSRQRLTLFVTDEGEPSIELFGPQGVAQTRLSLYRNGKQAITMLDDAGRERISFAVNEDRNAEVKISDRNSKKSLQLSVTEEVKSNPALNITDSQGRLRFQVGLQENNPNLYLLDEAHVRSSYGIIGPDGRPLVTLNDKDGDIIYAFGIDGRGAPFSGEVPKKERKIH
ncbi:hypothetical protein [Aquisphaera giovannonii]|uniref:hypothetical protein n=1 Tax=Aquisphaera giovannonii TaxID=406548 RepID=UPI0011DFC17A|nr:hypothetical protein [Aquisphaera giovannonii]